MNNSHTVQELIELSNRPLEEQYQTMFARCMEAAIHTDGDIVLCFSGGKDSALLVNTLAMIWAMLGWQSRPIRMAFANTTNETKNMREYIPWYIQRTEKKHGVKIELDEVRHANGDNIITVLQREGLPFVSKSTSSIVRKVRKSMDLAGVTYEDVKDLHQPTIECRDKLRDMGLNDTTVLAFTGWSCRRNDFGKEFVLAKRWMPMLDIKSLSGYDIEFSEVCCSILKKHPISQLSYKNVMTGEQALESKTRKHEWLKHGCNYTLPDGGFKSRPLGSLSVDAILYSLDRDDVPICKDYGQIVCDGKCYTCTGAQRTGCALCGFGIDKDPQRFIRLAESDPAKCRLAFKPIEDGGLGYLEVCLFLNEHCKTAIEIPKF